MMFRTRIVTAVLLLTVFLFSLFVLPLVGFAAFIVVVFLLAVWEWSALSGWDQRHQKYLYCGLSLLLLVGLGHYIGLLPSLSMLDDSRLQMLFLIASIWWAVALLWVQGYPSSTVLWGNSWVCAAMGWLVLIPCCLGLVFLRQQPQGEWLILLLVLSVAAADTGAYFAGKKFGQTPLAKKVSPGKTWEGVLGGALSCLVLSSIAACLIDSISWFILLMMVVALVSVLGDLLESMVKRYRGVKDSGNLLPGHGGVLDRIDGLTAAVPVFTLMIIFSDGPVLS